MLTHSAQNDSEQASEKAKFAQKASNKNKAKGKPKKPSKPEQAQTTRFLSFWRFCHTEQAKQGKNAKPSLAQSLNPKRDFALRSKKPAEQAKKPAQKCAHKSHES